MGPSNLRRYERLLVEKRRELSSAPREAHSRVPAAGGLEGDLIEQANADEEAELQIRLHQTDGRSARAIEEALARINQGTYGCVRSVTSLSLRLVWKRCLGRTSAVSARNASTQPPNDGERTNNQVCSVLGVRLIRTRIMGKLSSHIHECPRCGMKWECGEANYQDECP
jgi:RNA polymerase-binding transcription factor DksA